MAPADNETQRAIGRIEGQLTHIIATLDRVEEIHNRTVHVEHQVKSIPALVKDVADIQQMARDGKMTGKGVMLGFGLATAAGGATLATMAKQIWLALTGA